MNLLWPWELLLLPPWEVIIYLWHLIIKAATPDASGMALFIFLISSCVYSLPWAGVGYGVLAIADRLLKRARDRRILKYALNVLLATGVAMMFQGFVVVVMYTVALIVYLGAFIVRLF